MPNGWQILRPMIHRQDIGILNKLMEDTMGFIPDSADTVLEDAPQTETKREFTPLPAGDYQGVVHSATIGESRKPWVNAELKLKLEVMGGSHAGEWAFADIEVSPLTSKDGQLSPGKLKFLKWQLSALGYDGKLSDFEYNVESVIGAVVNFEQKDEDSGRLNEKTGRNYRNREVLLKDNVLPGAGGTTPVEQAVN